MSLGSPWVSRHSQLVFSRYTLDNFDYWTPPSKRAQEAFETAFGYPTDIDKVWAAREEYQDKIQENSLDFLHLPNV